MVGAGCIPVAAAVGAAQPVRRAVRGRPLDDRRHGGTSDLVSLARRWPTRWSSPRCSPRWPASSAAAGEFRHRTDRPPPTCSPRRGAGCCWPSWRLGALVGALLRGRRGRGRRCRRACSAPSVAEPGRGDSVVVAVSACWSCALWAADRRGAGHRDRQPGRRARARLLIYLLAGRAGVALLLSSADSEAVGRLAGVPAGQRGRRRAVRGRTRSPSSDQRSARASRFVAGSPRVHRSAGVVGRRCWCWPAGRRAASVLGCGARRPAATSPSGPAEPSGRALDRPRADCRERGLTWSACPPPPPPAGSAGSPAPACGTAAWPSAALLASVSGSALEAVGPAADQGGRGRRGGRLDRACSARWSPALVGLALVRFGTSFLRRYLAGRLALDVQHDLRRQVFAAVQRLDGRRQDALRTGQVVSRAITDLQLVQALLSMVPLAARHAGARGGRRWRRCCGCRRCSPLVALVMLPVAAWSRCGPGRRCSRPPGRPSSGPPTSPSRSRRRSPASAWSRASARRPARSRRWSGPRGRLFAERMRAARLTARLNPTLLALPALGQVAVIGLGGWLALNGSITLGTFLAFTTYVAQLVGPARLIGALVVSAQLARAGVERVYDLIDSQPDVVDPADAGRAAGRAAGDRAGRRRASATPAASRCSTASRCGSRPGRRSRWSAPPGSGKSTVALLLPRFYDPQARRAAPRRGAAARAAAGRAAPRARGGVRGGVPVLRHHPGQHRLRPPGRHRRGGRGGGRGPRRSHEFVDGAAATATTPWSASAG